MFSKWIKYRGKEKEVLDDNELIEYYEELNRMSFEMSLWIKDHELLTGIMHRLQNHSSAKDTRNIIGDIRKLILEDVGDNFDSSEITLWQKD